MKLKDGPYLCHFRCGAKLTTKYDRVAIAGWNWFTGASQRTVHICPSCSFTRAAEVGKMMRGRGLEPSDEILDQPYPILESP